MRDRIGTHARMMIEAPEPNEAVRAFCAAGGAAHSGSPATENPATKADRLGTTCLDGVPRPP